jgi:hypothetical protein
MSDNYYPHLLAYCVTPCPQCGGVVGFGDVMSWPAEHGGEYRGCYLSCSRCSWSTDVLIDEHDDDQLPDEFFSSAGPVLGWSPDGRFLCGCEGPVLEGGTGNHS